MRIKDLLLQEKVDQLVQVDHDTARGIIHYTMALRKVGKDGSDRPVYVGNCLITKPDDESFSKQTFCAVVFRGSGSLLAMKHGESLAEVAEYAGIAIATARIGYGLNLRDHKKNWLTFNHTTVRGLNLDKRYEDK